MKKVIIKKEKRERRRKRIRAKISGTPSCPRISIFKSNKYIVAQLIDDTNGKTLFGISSKDVKGKNNVEKAFILGESISLKAKELGINKAVFDRGGFMYTGSIKAVSDGARKNGLEF